MSKMQLFIKKDLKIFFGADSSIITKILRFSNKKRLFEIFKESFPIFMRSGYVLLLKELSDIFLR